MWFWVLISPSALKVVCDMPDVGLSVPLPVAPHPGGGLMYPMGDFDAEGSAPGGVASKCCPGGTNCPGSGGNRGCGGNGFEGGGHVFGTSSSCRVSPGVSGDQIGCAGTGKLSPGDPCHPGEPICPPALGQ